MNKTILIIKHEFLQTLRRKSFIIMTLAFPVLGLLAIGGYQVIQGITPPPAPGEEVTIGYIDEVGIFNDFTEQPGEPPVSLVTYTTPEEATGDLLEEDISEYFIIPSDYLTTGLITRFTLERELEPPKETREAITSFLVSNLLGGQTSSEVIERVKSPLLLNSITLDETGQIAKEQGGPGAFIVPYLFSILLLIAIFTSSGFLLQGLGEEKENRIIEILLSSVSAQQLLTGKVLGLGAAGLAQMLVWLLTARVLVEMASTTIGGLLSTLQIPGDLLVLSLVYFILGYLLFAVIMAGAGSIGATAREGQQMTVIFTLPAVVPLWLTYLIVENPDHVVSQILTLFPLTAPITVMIRLGTADIPVWQLVVSIILMIVTIIGLLVLAAKIFRTFLLMYGKTPRLGEIVRYLRQA